MAQVIYSGGFDAVDIPSLDYYEVARGEAIEVPDEVAVTLCESPDWSTVTPAGNSGNKAPAPPAPDADKTPATPDASTTDGDNS